MGITQGKHLLFIRTNIRKMMQLLQIQILKKSTETQEGVDKYNGTKEALSILEISSKYQ